MAATSTTCRVSIPLRQGKTELSLKNLTAVLDEVPDWYTLGIQLDVPDSKLDEIELNYPTVRRRRTEMIKWWLKNSCNASWEQLATALEKMREHGVLVAKIRETYTSSCRGVNVSENRGTLQQPIIGGLAEKEDTPPKKRRKKRLQFNWVIPNKTAPFEWKRGSCAVGGENAYFAFGESTYAYNLSTDKWSCLPVCPHTDFCLAVIDTKLTTIGGWKSPGCATNTLLSLLDSQEWAEIFPPMPTKRAYAATVSTGCILVVAGGMSEEGLLAVVEVFYCDTRVWYAAQDLPNPWKHSSMAICSPNGSDMLYILGGYVEGRKTLSVYRCAVQDLQQTCNEVAVSRLVENTNIWHRVADGPKYWSTCVNIKEKLLIVGGCDEAWTPSTALHMYNPETDNWDFVSSMQIPRHSSFAVVLSTNKLLVLGGNTLSEQHMNEPTNLVELALYH